MNPEPIINDFLHALHDPEPSKVNCVARAYFKAQEFLLSYKEEIKDFSFRVLMFHPELDVQIRGEMLLRYLMLQRILSRPIEYTLDNVILLIREKTLPWDRETEGLFALCCDELRIFYEPHHLYGLTRDEMKKKIFNV